MRIEVVIFLFLIDCRRYRNKCEHSILYDLIFLKVISCDSDSINSKLKEDIIFFFFLY